MGAPSQQELEDLIYARMMADGVYTIRDCFGHDLWAKQEAIVRSVWQRPKTAVRSGHGTGKSYSSARIALAFLTALPGSTVVTTAPTHRQVEKILWKEIRSGHRTSRMSIGGRPLLTELKIRDDWFAFGFATDVPDNFQGMHAPYILVIVDEASGVAAPIWEALEGLLAGGHSRLLAIGNPTDPTGDFAALFKEPGVAKHHISVFDTPNFTATGITQADIESGEWEAKSQAYLAERGEYPYPALVTPEWVASRFKKWGKDSPLYQSRVLGDFPKEADNVLIPLSWIEAAHRRQWDSPEPQEGQESPKPPRILGVDVAWQGSDLSAIYRRTGRQVRRRATISGMDPMQLTGMVANLMNEEAVDCANVDVIGIGAGVATRLDELGHPVQAINVGAGAYDPERFANLRAEIFWNLREALDPKNPNALDLDEADEELTEELSVIRFKHRSNGQIVIEPKDGETAKWGIKKRLGRSPDRADAVALSLIPKMLNLDDDDDDIIFHEEDVSISPV